MAQRILTVLACAVGFLAGQTPSLNGHFSRFITYYVSSVDISTGESDVQLFSYALTCPDCPDTDGDNRYDVPPSVTVSFLISIQSPALGLEDETTLARIETTQPFTLSAPIRLDNREFTVSTKEIFDVNGDRVPLKIDVVEQLAIEDFNEMFSAIVTTGRLPDGLYRFHLSVSAEGGAGDAVEEVLNIFTPSTVQLTSPGGPFDRISENQVYTLFPIFQWNSETFSAGVIEDCSECGFFIRIAEFICGDHATVEDAMSGVSVLPIDQAQGWQLVNDLDGSGEWEASELAGSQLTFQYPTVGAIDLKAGGLYVWQLEKRLSTTAGVETISSPIYAFQVKDLSVDPLMQSLASILPTDLAASYFTPCGPLTGYKPSGTVKLDGVEADISVLNALVSEFQQGTRTLILTEVR